MKRRQLHIFIATQVLLVVLGIGQASQADIFIPASSRASGIVVEPGLKGFFYDRDDPAGTINSLAMADAIIASSTPSATFSSTLVDYPNGDEAILFLPMLGELLGVDAAGLNPPGAAASAASPMVMRFMGVIHVTEALDIDPSNSTIDVQFALGSDDGSRLRIGGQTLISIDGTGVFFDFPPEQIEVASFEAPGLYPVDIVWYDHFGGTGIAWYSSISGGPDSGAPAGTAGIVPTEVLGILEPLLVDIKPGSFPNSINVKSKGVIPVAILTTSSFDATAVAPLSVAFGPNGAMEAHGQGHIEDADGDGDLDLVLHFRTQDTGIQCGATSAFLTGETFDGQVIQGSDSIKLTGCK